MSKKKCEQKEYTKPENARFECKKCGRASKKEEKICKPVKVSR